MSPISKVARLGVRLLKLAATNPSRLSHVCGTALAATDDVMDWQHDLLRFRCMAVNDLLPTEGPPLKVELALFLKSHASVSVLEFTCLVLLLHRAKARKIFAFETFKGISITQLALNLPADSQIYTLDLPGETLTTKMAIADPTDAAIAKESGKGSLVPAELRSRIQLLKHISATTLAFAVKS